MRDFGDYMTDTDAILWNMERDPRLRGTVTTVLVLDRAPEWDRLVDTMERVSRGVSRFRQRVVEPPLRLAPPRWVVDPDFDISSHLHHVTAPPPGDLRSVLDLAQSWASTGMDKERPLWDYTLIEGLADGRAALVQKVHHSMSDGLGGMEMALEFFDAERDPHKGPLHEAPEAERVGAVDLVRDAIGMRSRQVAGTLQGLPARAPEAMTALRHPVDSTVRAVEMARSAVTLLAPATKTLSPVMQDRSPHRHFGVLDVDLDDLRRAAKAEDATVNDAFLAGVSGGLRRYHEFQAAPVDALRVTLPVSVRREGDSARGNRITTLRYEVPVGVGDPARRLREIHDVTEAMRNEPAVEATAEIAGLLNWLPTPIMSGLFGAMLLHVDFLGSNVPGFPTTTYVAGAQALRWYAFGPTEGAALNVTLLSHAGTCCMGVNVDAAAVDDPEALFECLEDGFEEVLSLAG